MDRLKKYKSYILTAFGILFYSVINNAGAISIFLGKIFGLISIFIYGMIISIFLNPVLEYLEKHSKLSRIKSILAIYVSLLVIMILLIFWGVPSFIDNIRTLTKEVPIYITKLNEVLGNWIDKFKFFDRVNLNTELKNVSQYIMGDIESILINSFGSIVKTLQFVLNFLVALILSGFFLAKKEYFNNLIKEVISLYFSEKNTVKIYFLGQKLNEVFLGWLHGKTIDSLIIGTIGFTILTLMKIPYAVFLGVLIYITNYVPYLGPMFGIIICAVVTFFTLPSKILYVIIALVLLQQFDAWYLEAKCFKKTLKIDMFWGIAAVLLGGSVGGPVWIILMIPTFAFIKDMYLMRKEDFQSELD